jgi:hypothetical protein
MMGLFDSMNFDDPATMGLLSAGLNMIGNSGRGTNMSTGAILANGAGAGFQGAQVVRDGRTHAELLKRKMAEDDLHQQHLQMGVDAQKQTLADNARLRDFYNKRNTQGQDTLGQVSQAMGGNMSPTNANVDNLRQAQAQVQSGASNPFDQRMSLSRDLRRAGFQQQAEAEETSALKFQPKVKEWGESIVNGKAVRVPFYEDGTVGKPSDFDVAKALHFQDTGSGWSGRNSMTGAEVTSGNKTQTLESQASERSAAATRAQAERHFNVTQANQDSQGMLTPEAIKNAADRYNVDGTLPPMGMGKNGAIGRSQILNQAANDAGTDQRVTQLTNKANTAALSKLQQSQTMIGAFERNFHKNADLLLEKSKEYSETGSPILNKGVNAFRRNITGNPDLASMDILNKSVMNEYAKIISGSMGNTAVAEGEIKKAEALLNSASTHKQREEVIKTMFAETENRMKGMDEEKAILRNSMKGGQAESVDRAATMRYNVKTGKLEKVN